MSAFPRQTLRDDIAKEPGICAVLNAAGVVAIIIGLLAAVVSIVGPLLNSESPNLSGVVEAVAGAIGGVVLLAISVLLDHVHVLRLIAEHDVKERRDETARAAN